MNILLQNIVPAPLQETLQSSIFNFDQLLLEKGKSYVFSAPSGKGKSTLLSYLFGLRNDYTGSISYDNINLLDINLQTWAKYRQSKISIVFQDLRLFESLTAFENIKIKNELTQFKTDDEIMTMAEQIQILPLLNKKANTLSMGQQQRVAILRALCQPFDWLYLDEPFSHLDKQNVLLIKELLEHECTLLNAGLVLTSLGDHLSFDFNDIIQL